MLIDCCYRFSPKSQIYTGIFDSSSKRIVGVDIFEPIDVPSLIGYDFAAGNYTGESSYVDIVTKFMLRDVGLVAINFNEHAIIEIDNDCFMTDSFISLQLVRYDYPVKVLNYNVEHFGVAKTKLLTCKRAQPIALLACVNINGVNSYLYNGEFYELTFPIQQISLISQANLSQYVPMLSRSDAVGIATNGQIVVRDDTNKILRLE